MNKNKFRAKMMLHGDTTITSLASYLSITGKTLAMKINGISDFSQSEMYAIKERYNLSQEEFIEMFEKDVSEYESERSRKTVEQV